VPSSFFDWDSKGIGTAGAAVGFAAGVAVIAASVIGVSPPPSTFSISATWPSTISAVSATARAGAAVASGIAPVPSLEHDGALEGVRLGDSAILTISVRSSSGRMGYARGVGGGDAYAEDDLEDKGEGVIHAIWLVEMVEIIEMGSGSGSGSSSSLGA
jgi:hypothetical protein